MTCICVGPQRGNVYAESKEYALDLLLQKPGTKRKPNTVNSLNITHSHQQASTHPALGARKSLPRWREVQVTGLQNWIVTIVLFSSSNIHGFWQTDRLKSFFPNPKRFFFLRHLVGHDGRFFNFVRYFSRWGPLERCSVQRSAAPLRSRLVDGASDDHIAVAKLPLLGGTGDQTSLWVSKIVLRKTRSKFPLNSPHGIKCSALVTVAKKGTEGIWCNILKHLLDCTW